MPDAYHESLGSNDASFSVTIFYLVCCSDFLKAGGCTIRTVHNCDRPEGIEDVHQKFQQQASAACVI